MFGVQSLGRLLYWFFFMRFSTALDRFGGHAMRAKAEDRKST